MNDPGRFLRMSYLSAGVGGVGFFAMSVLLLGVWPAATLDDETRRMSPAHALKLTGSEERGRRIYSREGCAYCHTQQIRYLPADVQRFGKPTLAWETRFDYPHLWGTRRIGPDLSREGVVRSEDWQYSHLYSPRSVVPDSVMPPYPTMFSGSADNPNQDARDLIAYIESLGRPRELAGPEGEAKARQGCDCPEDMKRLEFSSSPLNSNPAVARREGSHPELQRVAASSAGSDLFLHNCAGCHGSRGEGDGPGAAGLHPKPANLAAHAYTLDRISFALWNGVSGTAMPGWRDISAPDLASIAATVRSLHETSPEPAPPIATLQLGKQVYQDRCAQCHGDEGDGGGSAAKELRMAPTNFTAVQPSAAEALKALRNGVEGTPMAAWSAKLSEAELSSVAYFVRGFYKPDRMTP